MKLTDLHKNRGLKIAEDARKAGVPGRFGKESAAVPDRREQRRLDAAAGLVPFACKIPSALVARLRDEAAKAGGDLNAIVAAALERGLDATAAPAPTPPAATDDGDKPAPKTRKKKA